MAHLSMESVVESPSGLSFLHDQDQLVPIDRSVKLRGRKRLLAGFQRMTSSSSSLPKLARESSYTAYASGGAGSVSCVSLRSSRSPYGNPDGSLFASQVAGFSTAATSVNSPGLDTPFFDPKGHVRFADTDSRGTSSASVSFERKSRSLSGTSYSLPELEEDYFAEPVRQAMELDRRVVKRRENFNFWEDLPSELKMQVLQYLTPKQIVRCSAVSKSWHQTCFDGQLWAILDTSGYYRDIPAEALVKIITSAGPFVRDLNLRGCVQLRERWNAKGLADACRNLENFSLEGCRIDRSSIHCFLLQNTRLVHINLSGLAGATNSAMKIIAQYCPKIEHLNVSWCNNIDTRGLRKVVEACGELRDLRAGEIRGWDDKEFCWELFQRNTLERLILMNCDSLSDESLTIIMEGVGNETDILTGRPIVPPRKLRHLDLTRCRGITEKGVASLVNNVPNLEGLQLSKCHGITDTVLISLFPTMPRLTHLDLEELDELTNASLLELAKSPCHNSLEHLSVSYCEALGDTSMLPVVKACTNLRSLDMDNTRVSDLVLAEAAAVVRRRPVPATQRPSVGLRLVVYDCQNVTWTGVREVLSRNAEIRRLPSTASTPMVKCSSPYQPPAPVQAKEIISLKCFYGWQPTVAEHTKRVLRGDFVAATRLERKWAEFMMASEEAGADRANGGALGRRRMRRRVREARMMHADEEGEDESGDGVGSGMGSGGVGLGRRRRARSGGCSVM